MACPPNITPLNNPHVMGQEGQGMADAALWSFYPIHWLMPITWRLMDSSSMTPPPSSQPCAASRLSSMMWYFITPCTNPITLVGTTSKSDRWRIEPQKCCGLVYSWEPDQCRILQLSQPDQAQHILSLSNGQAQESIPVNTLQDSTCYLGLYITMDCNTKLLENHL